MVSNVFTMAYFRSRMFFMEHKFRNIVVMSVELSGRRKLIFLVKLLIRILELFVTCKSI
jgi:hypothetical protein